MLLMLVPVGAKGQAAPGAADPVARGEQPIKGWSRDTKG
jgi:hypothetical protein